MSIEQVQVRSSAPVVSCLIAAAPRSGAWMLADLLAQTGLAGHPDEYFRPELRQLWFEEWRLGEAPGHRVHLDRAVANGTGSNGVFAAKLQWHHLSWLLGALRSLTDPAALDPDPLARWLPHPRFVYLQRAEPARQAVSWYRAIHSGEFFRLAGAAEGNHDPGPERISPDLWQIRWLERLIAEQDNRWRDWLAACPHPTLEVSYQELVTSPSLVVRKVLRHLEVHLPEGIEVPATRLVRQSNEESEAWLRAYLDRRGSLGRGSEPWPPPEGGGTAGSYI